MAAGLTQMQVVDKLCISRLRLQQFERDEKRPSGLEWQKLSLVYDLSSKLIESNPTADWDVGLFTSAIQ